MRPGQHKRVPNYVIGLALIVLIAIGSVFAYTKKLPWAHGYEVRAVFTTAENVTVKTPVRIAGVNVGTVTGVQHLTSDDPAYQAAVGKAARKTAPGAPAGQQAAVVTMEINDDGRPIHEDATFKLRPRLFLEGNLFVDLHPGSPESPEAPGGHVFPISQTAVAVQLDQVLTSLQSDTRKNLQIFLKEFGNSLIKYNGANGLRENYRTSPGAYKYTSEVNQALLGTQPNDLSGLVKNLDSTIQALDADQSGLQNLVTNLRVVTGSFAAHDRALSAAVGELPRVLSAARPTLASLNASFPPLRAFAREALPGVRSTPQTLDAATPLLQQVRGLVSKPELRGLTHDLRPTIPRLTKLTKRTIPFLHTSRALASCFNEVIIPWSNMTVPDSSPASGDPSFPAAGKVYQETGYGLAGIGGESRSGDANGEYIRVGAGGGTNTVMFPPNTYGVSDQLVGQTPFPLLGGLPSIPSSAKTPFRPNAPCERQQPPNLDPGSIAAPPTQSTANTSASAQPAALQQLEGQDRNYITELAGASALAADGKRSKSSLAMKKIQSSWQSFQKNTEPRLLSELRSLAGGSR